MRCWSNFLAVIVCLFGIQAESWATWPSNSTTFSGISSSYYAPSGSALTAGYATPYVLTASDVASTGWDIVAESNNNAATFSIRGITSVGSGDTNSMRVQGAVSYFDIRTNNASAIFDFTSMELRFGATGDYTVQALDYNGSSYVTKGSPVTVTVSSSGSFASTGSFASNSDFVGIYGVRVTLVTIPTSNNTPSPYIDNIQVTNVRNPTKGVLTFETGTGTLSSDVSTSMTFAHTTTATTFTVTTKTLTDADGLVRYGSTYGAAAGRHGDESIYVEQDGKAKSVTFAIESGKVFTVNSFYLSNQNGDGDETFTITTSKGGSTTGVSGNSSPIDTDLITLPSTSDFQGVTWFKISAPAGGAFMEIDDIVVTDIASTPTTYTVTYNGNSNTGGTAPTDGSSPYNSGSTVTVLGNTGSLTRTGYTFAGWNTAANGSGTDRAASSTFSISANTTLYAKWTGSVSYNSNGATSGTVPTDSSAYLPGATVTAASNSGSLTKTGYTFAGWNTAADGSGTTYTAGSGTFSMSGDATLYAKWTASVTYNGNSNTGGTVPTDSTAYLSGATVTVANNSGSLTRTGYTFAGWNTAADGSGSSYAATDTFTINAATTLYAKWTGTVTYNGNGNSGGTVPTDASAYLPSATVTAAGNSGSLTRTGYSFAGWNTAANGSGTSYTAGSGTFSFTGNATLYAKWTGTVTYDGNGATSGTAPSDAGSYLPSATVTAAGNSGSLTKTGYTFAGWNTATDGSGTTYTAGSGTLSFAGSTTLYAKWVLGVTYDGNGNSGGAVPTDNTAYSSGATVTVLGNTGTLTRTGYTFAGWNTAANGTGTSYSAADTFTINSAATLYAKWTGSVTYDGNGNTGGTVPTDAGAYLPGATVTVANNTGSLTKTGFSFGGWNTAADGTGTSYTAGTGTFSMSGNATLYAKWNDATAPTLAAANVAVNNQSDPHKVVLTFSEALAPASLGTAANWTVTANGGSPTYSIAGVALSGGNTIVTVTLNAVDLTSTTTYIPNSAANAHLRVTPPATLTDVAGNAYAAGQVTESGATHTLDSTAPTLSAVSSSAPTSSGGTLAATASEKAKGYWIAIAQGATAPTPAQVKAAVTYSGVTIVASGNGVLPNGTAGSLTLSGLAASTTYDIYLMAEDAAGNPSAAASSASLTTAAAPAPSSGGGSTSSSTTTLPTGGGTAAPTGGQTVVVSDNGKNGSTINLPPPTSTTNGTTTTNTVAVQLPNSGGTVNVQSNTTGTQLGVQTTTLPGSTTPVTTVTVDQGSATFTATGSGQAVAGLKNGIIVVSGTSNSRVTVDTTGGSPTIGVANTDTIIVPTGIPNVAGTVVNLPSPGTTGGSATPVTVQTGTQTLSVQATGSGSTINFATTNVGGTTTPVVTIGSGSATVSGSGNGQPLVAMGGGSTVITAGGGTGSNRCNVVTEVTNSSNRDIVQVNTCYIVVGSGGTLRPGAYREPNAFAEVKDGIVWAGETADFDKDGKVTAVYLGTKVGTTNAVGDDTVPGGNKFTASGYTSNAFIPRLKGTAKRLSDANLDERIYATVNQALSTSLVPATPAQDAQGILTFQVSGGTDAEQKAQSTLTFDLKGDQVVVFPSKRIYVDTARADGISVSKEGNVEVATGGLITTFVPSVADPQGFANDLGKALPGSTSQMRWNGSWQLTTAEGKHYVGRPQWGAQASSGANGFTALPDNTVQYVANGRAQILFPDLNDYSIVQSTFAKDLNDANLSLAPRMNGTVQATVLGRTYLLSPYWELIPSAQIVNKPAWWLDNGVVFIKNSDGTAQGFTVR